mmetsp:Transcript_23243/g.32466  ORF Transcript_23243/g.32466 Transcript_23243/m.32466 type:complete len:199 (+) Transcript_23243:146-742(+)
MQDRKGSSGRSRSSRSMQTGGRSSASLSLGSITVKSQDKYAAPSSGDSCVSESTWVVPSEVVTESRVGVEEEVEAFNLLAKSYQSKLSTLVEDYQEKLETIDTEDVRDEVEEFRKNEARTSRSKWNAKGLNNSETKGRTTSLPRTTHGKVASAKATESPLQTSISETMKSFWNKGTKSAMPKAKIGQNSRGDESLYTC